MTNRLLAFARHWKVAAKLCVMATAFAIPIVTLLFLLTAEKNIAIQFGTEELAGNAMLRPLRTAMEYAPGTGLNGDPGKTDGAVAEFAELAKLHAAIIPAEKEAATLASANSDQLIPALRAAVAKVGDQSNLILDPDLDSYYLMDATLLKTPDGADLLRQTVAFAVGVSERKRITAEERTELVVKLGLLKSNLAGLRADFQVAFENNPAANLKPALEGPVAELTAPVERFIELVETKLVKPAAPQATPTEIAESGQAALGGLFKLWDETIVQLDNLLNARIAGFQARKTTALLLVAAALLLSLAFVMAIGRQISGAARQMSAALAGLGEGCIAPLNSAIQALAQGDLAAKVDIHAEPLPDDSRDEFGQMAKQYNRMLARAEEMHTDFRTAQLSLRRLVADVAAGAAAVNEASERVRLNSAATGQASAGMAVAISDVSGAAGASAQTCEQIALGAEQQAQSANSVSEAMSRLEAAMQSLGEAGQRQHQSVVEADREMRSAGAAAAEVATGSRQMAASAREAAAVARDGGEAVQRSIQTLQSIQGEVERSARRVRNLGDQGSRIGAIVETIGQIAEQTNMLALNAAIEAARAGESGRGFAVVAEEVRRLAERAGSSANQIGDLIETVRREVDEAVAAMETSTEQVRAGAELGQEAHTALEQILASVEQLCDQVTGVAESSDNMANRIEKLGQTVRAVGDMAAEETERISAVSANSTHVHSAIVSVAAVSEQTAAGAQEMSATAGQVSSRSVEVNELVNRQVKAAQETAEAAAELEQMARRLRETIARFRIEEEDGAPPLRLAA